MANINKPKPEWRRNNVQPKGELGPVPRKNGGAMNEQREAIAESLFTHDRDATGALIRWGELLDNYGRNGVAGKSVYRDTADAVIAHLWQRADDPEVVEAVAETLYDLRVQDGNSLSHDGTLGGIPYVSWRNAEITKARTAITTLLTALLGPNPNEQEDSCG